MAEKDDNSEPKQHSPREYQLELLEAAKRRNIIVCLGTGTGKTFISIKLIEYLARKDDIIRRSFSDGARRTFFLVNSVPLVFQQATAIETHTALKVKGFCGEMKVDFWTKTEWLQHFEENHVLVMTHQIFFDLLQHAKIKMNQANLLVFDECHHANKKHPFKRIMDKFADEYPDPTNSTDEPRILGLTASVVGQKVKPCEIKSKIKQLEATMRSVCETASDPDVVEKYGAKPKEGFQEYSSSKHSDPVAMYLENEMDSILSSLQQFFLDVKVTKDISGTEDVIERELSISKSAIRECTSALTEVGVWGAYEVSRLLVIDLAERYKRVAAGLSPLSRLACLFLQVTMTCLREVGHIYNEFWVANQREVEVQQEYLKPKVKKLLELFQKGNRDICSIIFVERRYAACVVSKLINQMAISAPREYGHLTSDFVTGHGAAQQGLSDTEMKFNEQKKKLQDFRTGEFNVLVGTSVVEEGVDIPKCNLVVMFDFPKNYRAYVQSRGRGRAKDARYMLLVERSERRSKRDEQRTYQAVDDELKWLCRTRSLPTEEEANDAVTVDLLEPYFTKIRAKVDMGSSVSLLARYCSKLPCDRFTNLKPNFVTNDVGGEYICTLQLPRNSPLTGWIEGEAMPNKAAAKQAVALKACIELHKVEELNDNLLPVEYIISDSEDEDVDETDGSNAKTGTKKRRRSHKIKVISELDEPLLQSGTVYVYAIRMKVTEVSKSEKSQAKKMMWDRKDYQFGLVTSKKLPWLPAFSLFPDIGEISINVDQCLTLPEMTSRQLAIVNWFHRDLIFKHTLRFSDVATSINVASGCRVVLLSLSKLDTSPPRSAKRPYSPHITGIDYEEMRRIKNEIRHGLEHRDLEDCIVIAKYRETCKTEYHVQAIDPQLTPLSPFPDPTKARTFKSYFENKYENCKIFDDHQPLVQAVPFRFKIDYRPFHKGDEPIRHHQELLIPEICTRHKCPQSIALRACLLPSILYRLHGLLGAYELRKKVSADLQTKPGIHNEALSPPRNGFLPRKLELEDFVDSEDNSSCSSSDDDDIPEASTDHLACLDSCLDISRSSSSVPLTALLEALTCASSADQFDLERLEMLGDSFLKMAVSISVFWHNNRHSNEGRLTRGRSKQISNKNLFKIAVAKDLPEYVKYERLTRETAPGSSMTGHQQQNVPDKSVADCVEALIGAYLTNCGYLTALAFMDWLGLGVLCKDKGTGRRSQYANYPKPSFPIPEGQDNARFGETLEKQTKEMASFETAIGYRFRHKVLLLEAFTHPTFMDQTITGSYQCLEFLGDAILDFLVTQHIYFTNGRHLTPGKLTDLRSALVNNNTFATIAVEKKFHKYLKSHSPELFTNIGIFVTACHEYFEEGKINPDPYVIAMTTGQEHETECIEAPKPLGDIFESVAGAIFLDSGLDIRAVWEVYYPMLKNYIDAYSGDVPLNPLRQVYQFDNGVKFGHAKVNEDGRSVTCQLRLSEEKAAEIGGQREFVGTGRNKHNAKLSAAYKASQVIKKCKIK